MKKSQAIKKHGFTMMELVAVMVLVGLTAAVAIPNYRKAQERAVERTIADNLDIIWQAVANYRIKEGAYPPDMADTDTINTSMNLYILDDGGSVAYYCQTSTGRYQCQGVSNTYGWRLQVRDRSYGERPTRGGAQTAPTCNVQCSWITYPYTGDLP